MLDQENQVKVEHSTEDSNRPAQPAATTTTTNTSAEISVANCKASSEQQQFQLNKDNLLLSDHDYCSPNKNLHQVDHKDKMKQELVVSSEQTTAALDNQSSQASTLTASEFPPSTSSPSKQKSDSQIYNKNPNVQSMEKSDHVDDGQISDTSSSSSSLSDDDSNGLVIEDPRPKSLAPKDTPSVSKPKFGRRPSSNLGTKQHVIGQGQLTRHRRPRQNTSVTDKSQWITGEDQVDTALSEHLSDDRREKRQRKEVRDPDFSHFTSSDYSSSDAESDESDTNGDDDDDENDPNRPWCTCMQPHGDEFMICCDICAYWYHGKCVGVTAQQSKKFEKEKKEWLCGECQTHIANGTPRDAIPQKIVKNEKGNKASKSSRKRGRPRKSDVVTRESARLSSRLAARKMNTSLDSRLSTRKNPNKYDAARRESFESFADEQRLKGLIRERKQAFLFKRQLAEKERLAKMKELGMTSHSLTGSLGNSLDSLASSTNSPNMSNLPFNIKSEHQERPKPNIVLQINTKKDGEVTAVVKSKKRKSESSDQAVDDLFTSDPIQVNISSKTDELRTSSNTRRSSDSSKNDKNNTNEHHSPSASKKKRKISEPSATTSFGSKDIARKIKECLETRSKQLSNMEMPSSKIEKLANDIEGQLNECFKEGSQKYLNKYRSLIFNFTKNQELVKNVFSGEILPTRLVRMSPEEMAPHELAKWRERHSKHEIELIKHNAQLAAQQVIVKKTHKGEEVISAPLLNDPDDPSVEVNNQEPPTTPTKTLTKEARGSTTIFANKTAPDSIPLSQPPTALNVAIQIPQKEHSPKDQLKISISLPEPLPHVDSAKERNNHTFDTNCELQSSKKIVNIEEKDKVPGIQALSSVDTGNDSNSNNSDQSKVQLIRPSEPKRFRVSIETSLDPSNLSRLRDQPLIKPSERPPDTGGYSPSKVTPTAELSSNEEEDDDDDFYDPETMLVSKELPKISSSTMAKVDWSGDITMADVGKFSATVSPVSGDMTFMQEEISQNLLVCGRIRPEQVSSYVKQIKATTKNPIISIQFHPKTADDKATYDKLFDYLYTRNRYGVIDNRSHSQIFRDFYIIPIHEGTSIPDVSKPIQGPGLEKNHANCLLGLMVKTKRSAPHMGSTSMSISNNSMSSSTPS